MNQSGPVSSKDEKEQKQLAPGEFVYEFFQPTFDIQVQPLFQNVPAVQSQTAPAVTVETVPPAKTPASPVLEQQTLANVLPPSIADFLDSTFSADNIAPVASTPQTPFPSTAPAPLERHFNDDSGAVIYYGKWNIRPHRIKYPDRSVAEFEYDDAQLLVRVKDRDGMEWLRISQPDHKNISTWKSADDQTCEMSMVVLPDGTYQCISSAGVIQTCTLSGRIIVWTPFTDGFDLKRTLFAIFRRIDKNQDSTLSKDELELAARQIWECSDAIQLISMLQAHYEAICASRKHSLCRQGSGITIDDILAFDAATVSEQETRSCAPPHAVKMVRTIFDQMDIGKEGAVTLNQLRLAYDSRFSRDSVSSTILQTLYEELKRNYESGGNHFGSKSQNLTRSDLVQHYKDGYKKEIKGQIKIAGWGTDECWQAGETTTRRLYVDPANPLESIVPQAVRRVKSDPAMATFQTVFETFIVQCPHLIIRMISSTSDGNYVVTFPGAPNRPIIVQEPKSSLLQEYLHASKFGYWMAVIEEAFKQYDHQYFICPQQNHLERVEKVSKLLNGQTGHWINITDMQLSHLCDTMRRAFKQRRIMVAAGALDTPIMAGQRLVSNSSVCGVINFDYQSNKVYLNDRLRENGPDDQLNFTNIAPDGTFSISTANFASAFQHLFIEDWMPMEDILQH